VQQQLQVQVVEWKARAVLLAPARAVVLLRPPLPKGKLGVLSMTVKGLSVTVLFPLTPSWATLKPFLNPERP